MKVFSKNNRNYAVYLKCLVLPSDRKILLHSFSIFCSSEILTHFSLILITPKKIMFSEFMFSLFFIVYHLLYIVHS